MGAFCAIWTVRSAHKIVCKTLLVIMFVIARGARQILRYAQVGIFFLRPPVAGFSQVSRPCNFGVSVSECERKCVSVYSLCIACECVSVCVYRV